MVLGLEKCVTGTGEVVKLPSPHERAEPATRSSWGAKGTLAIVTSATLRLHPRPQARAFASWSLPSMELGWEAMRAIFQEGLRPAIARLYDPFDAMLARQGAVKKPRGDRKGASGAAARGPGLGQAALRRVLRQPNAMNELIELAGTRVLGGALLVGIFEGTGEAPSRELERARALIEGTGAKYAGEGAARRWLQHRYSMSYRQAPVFASGAFADTMEVAATLVPPRRAVRRRPARRWGSTCVQSWPTSAVRLPRRMLHLLLVRRQRAARGGGSARARGRGWDAACEETYDRTWRAAQDAVLEAGGTLAHHHGVGRSKAPRLGAELGAGVDVVRALQRAFDPHRILNPGNLLPPPDPPPFVPDTIAKEVVS